MTSLNEMLGLAHQITNIYPTLKTVKIEYDEEKVQTGLFYLVNEFRKNQTAQKIKPNFKNVILKSCSLLSIYIITS